MIQLKNQIQRLRDRINGFWKRRELLSGQLQAQDTSWVAGHPPAIGGYGAKTRYRQADAACRLDQAEGATFALDFAEPQWAVTPGQSAVLYDGEVCLGGGIIL